LAVYSENQSKISADMGVGWLRVFILGYLLLEIDAKVGDAAIENDLTILIYECTIVHR